MQSIVLASGNMGKLREFSRILKPLGIKVIPMSEAGFADDIPEDGKTFAENAVIKAHTVQRATGLPAIADDSGLCVDYLGGRPGVLSARYHGEHTPYGEKISMLLREMENCPDSGRTARFVSAIAFVDLKGKSHVFEADCEGVIGHAPSGSGGFGYDPIFYVQGGSFADLSPADKDSISHRGKALRMFRDWLSKAGGIPLNNQKESEMELSSKQRAKLRALANGIDTIAQIGKGEIEQNIIKQADEALTARELIKMRTLENSSYTPREAAEIISGATGAAVVQVIGTRFVLYRPHPKKPVIEL